MSIFDTIKYTATNELPLDSGTAQALKNALPRLADDIDTYVDNGALPKEYIDSTLVPAMAALGEAQRKGLIDVLAKNKGMLHNLASEVHASIAERQAAMDFVSRKGVAAQRLDTPLSQVVGTKIVEAGEILDSVKDLPETEKEEKLLLEVIRRAKSVQAKFDDFVYRGDVNKGYGPLQGSVQNLISGDDLMEFHGKEGKYQAYSEVEDANKNEIEDILQMLVDNAKNPKSTIVDFSKFHGGKLVNLGSKKNQLAEMASYLDALERGIDDANQGVLSSITSAPADLAVYLGSSLMPSNLTNTASSIIGIAAFGWALKKGWIQKGYSKVTGKLGATTTAGTPGTTPEGPKTPRRFVEVNPADLKDFKPGEANHEEYYKKTVEKIKSLGTATVAAPSITSAEVTKRTSLFMGLDKEYRGGKLSLAEYLKRTEDILAGRGRVLVVDHAGAIDKAESIKNVKQRIADRTPGVSQFTRNNPNGSASASVSAMQEAKKRIKGASYESVDYSGTKVEFADAANRMLFEEFRDKLQKYTEMQEWDAHNRGVIALEEQVRNIQNTDIPAKINEINAKNAQIAAAPARVPGPSMTYPPPAGSPPGTPGTIIPGPDIVNPDVTKFNSELSNLQLQLGRLNDKISDINSEIAKKGADVLPYRPKATLATAGTPAITPREQFRIDTRALKLELSSPGATTGLIQRINTAVGAGTIPESAFDRAALKIDKIRLLEVVKTALKK